MTDPTNPETPQAAPESPETPQAAPEPHKTATERLTELETLVNQGVVTSLVSVLREVNEIKGKFQQMEQLVAEMVQYINAIERVFGEDKAVTKETLREALLANRVDGQKAEIDSYLKQGMLKASDTVTNLSFVVFQELALDGKVLNPRNQIPINRLNGDVKDKFMGKKVNDLVSLTPDRNIQLTEIYEIVPPSPPKVEAPAEAATPAPETPPSETTPQEQVDDKPTEGN